MAKFVFVTGGVSSSLGKGLAASSLGRLLKSRGLRVTMCKLDPYINFDPGTMNPFEHGEVFVTDDGGETDLDLGHYERFIDENLYRISNVDDRPDLLRGHRKGASRRLPRAHRPGHPAHHRRDQGADQAARHRRDRRRHRGDRRDRRRHRDRAVPGSDPPVPPRRRAGQRLLRPPDARAVPRALGRAEDEAHPALGHRAAQPGRPARRHRLPVRPADLDDALKRKISLLCDVPIEAVVSAVDAASIYEIPLLLHEEGFDDGRLRDPSRSTGPGTHRPVRLGADRRAHRLGDRHRADRHRRQVRQPARRLPVGRRVAPSRRLPPRRAGRDRVDPGREVEESVVGAALGGLDGIVHPGRLRRTRHRGQDRRRRVRPRARPALSRAVPRAPGDGRRLRALDPRAGWRELAGVRPGDRRTR